MAGRSGFLPQDRREWLLAIGQRLRAEYAAIGDPIPERLAALVAQLEAPEPSTTADQAPSGSERTPRPATEPAPDRSVLEYPPPPTREACAVRTSLELC